jgi:hypothetical protein
MDKVRKLIHKQKSPVPTIIQRHKSPPGKSG